MQRALWPSILMLALAPAPSRAEGQSSAAGDRTSLALTLFSDGRGQVRDERTLLLPSGEAEIRFMDVPAQIDPTSVRVLVREGPPATVVEQVYAQDARTPAALVETVAEQGPTRVRRFSDDPAVQEVAHPALIWKTSASKDGRRRVETSYLTGGLSWQADYALSLDAEQATASLEGWVTVDNATSADFDDAHIQLVAGRLHTVPRGPQAFDRRVRAVGQAVPEDAPSESHLYALPGRVTLSAGERRQIRILGASSFEVRKEHVLRGDGRSLRQPQGGVESNRRVEVLLQLRSGDKGGHDVPLPAGVVRIYWQDRLGGSRLVGEDWVDHVPAGEGLRVREGDAFDVRAEHRQLDFESISPSVYESAHEVRITNHTHAAVVVRVSEPVEGSWMIVDSSHPVEEGKDSMIEFRVRVPAGEETVLTYRVRVQ